MAELNYFCVENLTSSNGTVYFQYTQGYQEKVLEYSSDLVSWISYIPATTANNISFPALSKLYFRLAGDQIETFSTETNRLQFSSSVNYKVSGNIMSLVDKTCTTTTIPGSYCFAYLFYNQQTVLRDASELILPATTLANYCYNYMFCNCQQLTMAAFNLPAITLTEGCYSYMFWNCLKLTSLPTFPNDWVYANKKSFQAMFGQNNRNQGPVVAPTIKIVASYPQCCQSMFTYCTKLVDASNIEIKVTKYYTQIEDSWSGSCSHMFSQCESLTFMPQITFDFTIGTYDPVSCLSNMFYYCYSLVDASNIIFPSIVFERCFSNMFYNCTSLISVSDLPATTLASRCYEYMFYGCASLTTMPNILAITLADHCYSWMFCNCTSLVTTTTLLSTILADYCYESMFSGCHSLLATPDLSNILQVAPYCCQYMFYNCSSLTNIILPAASTLSDYCYYYMFGECKSLTNLSSLILSALPALHCYEYMFVGCTSLELPPQLPATTLAEHCYAYMFSGCSALESSPNLPAITLASGCYYGMFSGIRLWPDLTNIDFTDYNVLNSGGLIGLFYGSLLTYEDLKLIFPLDSSGRPYLPATTLAPHCYEYMFGNCSKLTKAPELPATSLNIYCYSYMFYNSGLISTPELPAMVLANYCYYGMFASCDDLLQITNLPATTLAEYCYYAMFASCSKLMCMPQLQMTYLPAYCYGNMFSSCGIIISTITNGYQELRQNKFRIPATSAQYNATNGMVRTNSGTSPIEWSPRTNYDYYVAFTSQLLDKKYLLTSTFTKEPPWESIINFNSNGQQFNKIWVKINTSGTCYLYYGKNNDENILVATCTGGKFTSKTLSWTNQNYRTIHIKDGVEAERNTEFIEWLLYNSGQVAEAPTPTENISIDLISEARDQDITIGSYAVKVRATKNGQHSNWSIPISYDLITLISQKIGTSHIKDFRIGEDEVKKIYYGEDLIYTCEYKPTFETAISTDSGYLFINRSNSIHEVYVDGEKVDTVSED